MDHLYATLNLFAILLGVSIGVSAGMTGLLWLVLHFAGVRGVDVFLLLFVLFALLWTAYAATE